MTKRRGAVSFVADGETYELAMTVNAMLRYEDEAGETVFDTFAEMEGGDFALRKLVQMVRACLKGDTPSMDDVGDMIDAVGIQKMAEYLTEAVKLAFPEATGKSAGKSGKSRAI